MNRLRQLWPALLGIAAFAFAATLLASAGLGTADAARQFSAAMPGLRLCVYTRPQAGAPALDAAFVKECETLAGVRCALPVAELPATVFSHGYKVDVTVFAVPENKLQASAIALQSGDYPLSAWQPEALPGAGAAEQLAASAQGAGQGMPSRAKLAFGRSGDDSGMAPPADIRFSGAAAPGESDEGHFLWMDAGAVAAILERNAGFSKDAGLSLDPVRVELSMRDVPAMDTLASELADRGYLVVNPVERQALVLGQGKEMVSQWSVLAALAGALALLACRFRLRGCPMPFALALTVAGAAAGMLAAVALIQPAMLLGWRFLIAGDARYLMNLPRALAIFAVCAAIGILPALLSTFQKNLDNPTLFR